MIPNNPFPTRLAFPPKVQNPEVTIAIPTYKRLHLLKEAVESALAQKDAPNFEVIVVDNDSANDVAEWFITRSKNEPRLGYFANQDNLGIVGNWNQCVFLARSNIISILHDDDLIGPHFIKTTYHQLDSDIKAVVCSVEVGEIPSLDWTQSNIVRKFNVALLALGSLSPFPGVIFRKSDFINIGGFNNENYPVEDYYFWVRLIGNGKFKSVKSKQAFYRISPFQASNTLINDLVKKAAYVRRLAVKNARGPQWFKEHICRLADRNLSDVYKNFYFIGQKPSASLTNALFSYYRILIFKIWMMLNLEVVR